MISVGAVYALWPKLLGLQKMHSVRWIDTHFWLHTVGVVLYIVAMWIAGVMQGLMWRATNGDGTLTYTFVESLNATYPYYLVRLLGGLAVLAGMVLMAVNCVKTWQAAREVSDQPLLAPDPAQARAQGATP
jgi:cytochrome c oxidase cbb3-type subunit 1